MLYFLYQLAKLISALIENNGGDDEDKFEAYRELGWQFSTTGIDVDEMRAHLDPKYWDAHEDDGDPEMQYVWSIVNNIK